MTELFSNTRLIDYFLLIESNITSVTEIEKSGINLVTSVNTNNNINNFNLNNNNNNNNSNLNVSGNQSQINFNESPNKSHMNSNNLNTSNPQINNNKTINKDTNNTNNTTTPNKQNNISNNNNININNSPANPNSELHLSFDKLKVDCKYNVNLKLPEINYKSSYELNLESIFLTLPTEHIYTVNSYTVITNNNNNNNNLGHGKKESFTPHKHHASSSKFISSRKNYNSNTNPLNPSLKDITSKLKIFTFYFSMCFTNVHGGYYYGHFLKVYEEEYVPILNSTAMIPKYLIFISTNPFFNSFKSLLEELYINSITNYNFNFKTEHLLSNLLYKCLLPKYPTTQLSFSLLNNNYNFTNNTYHSEVSLRLLFTYLSPDRVALLFLALLMNSKIIFFHSQIEVFCPILVSFMQLLHPLSLGYNIINNLSPLLVDILETPSSNLIVGINKKDFIKSDLEDIYLKIHSNTIDLVYCDLDTNTVEITYNEEIRKPNLVPINLITELVSKLNNIVNCFDTDLKNSFKEASEDILTYGYRELIVTNDYIYVNTDSSSSNFTSNESFFHNSYYYLNNSAYNITNNFFWEYASSFRFNDINELFEKQVKSQIFSAGNCTICFNSQQTQQTQTNNNNNNNLNISLHNHNSNSIMQNSTQKQVNFKNTTIKKLQSTQLSTNHFNKMNNTLTYEREIKACFLSFIITLFEAYNETNHFTVGNDKKPSKKRHTHQTSISSKRNISSFGNSSAINRDNTNLNFPPINNDIKDSINKDKDKENDYNKTFNAKKFIEDSKKEYQPFLFHVYKNNTFDFFIQNLNHIVDQEYKLSLVRKGILKSVTVNNEIRESTLIPNFFSSNYEFFIKSLMLNNSSNLEKLIMTKERVFHTITIQVITSHLGSGLPYSQVSIFKDDMNRREVFFEENIEFGMSEVINKKNNKENFIFNENRENNEQQGLSDNDNKGNSNNIKENDFYYNNNLNTVFKNLESSVSLFKSYIESIFSLPIINFELQNSYNKTFLSEYTSNISVNNNGNKDYKDNDKQNYNCMTNNMNMNINEKKFNIDIQSVVNSNNKNDIASNINFNIPINSNSNKLVNSNTENDYSSFNIKLFLIANNLVKEFKKLLFGFKDLLSSYYGFITDSSSMSPGNQNNRFIRNFNKRNSAFNDVHGNDDIYIYDSISHVNYNNTNSNTNISRSNLRINSTGNSPSKYNSNNVNNVNNNYNDTDISSTTNNNSTFKLNLYSIKENRSNNDNNINNTKDYIPINNLKFDNNDNLSNININNNNYKNRNNINQIINNQASQLLGNRKSKKAYLKELNKFYNTNIAKNSYTNINNVNNINNNNKNSNRSAVSLDNNQDTNRDNKESLDYSGVNNNTTDNNNINDNDNNDTINNYSNYPNNSQHIFYVSFSTNTIQTCSYCSNCRRIFSLWEVRSMLQETTPNYTQFGNNISGFNHTASISTNNNGLNLNINSTNKIVCNRCSNNFTPSFLVINYFNNPYITQNCNFNNINIANNGNNMNTNITEFNLLANINNNNNNNKGNFNLNKKPSQSKIEGSGNNYSKINNNPDNNDNDSNEINLTNNNYIFFNEYVNNYHDHCYFSYQKVEFLSIKQIFKSLVEISLEETQNLSNHYKASGSFVIGSNNYMNNKLESLYKQILLKNFNGTKTNNNDNIDNNTSPLKPNNSINNLKNVNNINNLNNLNKEPISNFTVTKIDNNIKVNKQNIFLFYNILLLFGEFKVKAVKAPLKVFASKQSFPETIKNEIINNDYDSHFVYNNPLIHTLEQLISTKTKYKNDYMNNNINSLINSNNQVLYKNLVQQITNYKASESIVLVESYNIYKYIKDYNSLSKSFNIDQKTNNKEDGGNKENSIKIKNTFTFNNDNNSSMKNKRTGSSKFTFGMGSKGSKALNKLNTPTISTFNTKNTKKKTITRKLTKAKDNNNNSNNTNKTNKMNFLLKTNTIQSMKTKANKKKANNNKSGISNTYSMLDSHINFLNHNNNSNNNNNSIENETTHSSLSKKIYFKNENIKNNFIVKLDYKSLSSKDNFNNLISNINQLPKNLKDNIDEELAEMVYIEDKNKAKLKYKIDFYDQKFDNFEILANKIILDSREHSKQKNYINTNTNTNNNFNNYLANNNNTVLYTNLNDLTSSNININSTLNQDMILNNKNYYNSHNNYNYSNLVNNANSNKVLQDEYDFLLKINENRAGNKKKLLESEQEILKNPDKYQEEYFKLISLKSRKKEIREHNRSKSQDRAKGLSNTTYINNVNANASSISNVNNSISRKMNMQEFNSSCNNVNYIHKDGVSRNNKNTNFSKNGLLTNFNLNDSGSSFENNHNSNINNINNINNNNNNNVLFNSHNSQSIESIRQIQSKINNINTTKSKVNTLKHNEYDINNKGNKKQPPRFLNENLLKTDLEFEEELENKLYEKVLNKSNKFKSNNKKKNDNDITNNTTNKDLSTGNLINNRTNAEINKNKNPIKKEVTKILSKTNYNANKIVKSKDFRNLIEGIVNVTNPSYTGETLKKKKTYTKNRELIYEEDDRINNSNILDYDDYEEEEDENDSNDEDNESESMSEADEDNDEEEYNNNNNNKNNNKINNNFNNDTSKPSVFYDNNGNMINNMVDYIKSTSNNNLNNRNTNTISNIGRKKRLQTIKFAGNRNNLDRPDINEYGYFEANNNDANMDTEIINNEGNNYSSLNDKFKRNAFRSNKFNTNINTNKIKLSNKLKNFNVNNSNSIINNTKDVVFQQSKDMELSHLNNNINNNNDNINTSSINLAELNQYQANSLNNNSNFNNNNNNISNNISQMNSNIVYTKNPKHRNTNTNDSNNNTNNNSRKVNFILSNMNKQKKNINNNINNNTSNNSNYDSNDVSNKNDNVFSNSDRSYDSDYDNDVNTDVYYNNNTNNNSNSLHYTANLKNNKKTGNLSNYGGNSSGNKYKNTNSNITSSNNKKFINTNTKNSIRSKYI